MEVSTLSIEQKARVRVVTSQAWQAVYNLSNIVVVVPNANTAKLVEKEITKSSRSTYKFGEPDDYLRVKSVATGYERAAITRSFERKGLDVLVITKAQKAKGFAPVGAQVVRY